MKKKNCVRLNCGCLVYSSELPFVTELVMCDKHTNEIANHLLNYFRGKIVTQLGSRFSLVLALRDKNKS